MTALQSVVDLLFVSLQSGLVPTGTRGEVFQAIYLAFLYLGTAVGVVVIGYMSYKAWKYRDGGPHAEEGDGDRPAVGEMPHGGGGGRKLALSFSLSAVIVLSLIAWTYLTLLYVEQGSAQAADPEIEGEMVIEVTAYQFGWTYTYPNGHNATNTLVVPEDTRIVLRVTSKDVFHNFGSPELRVKADAIPGQYTRTWFAARQPGEYAVQCYELCGSGHTWMNGTIEVRTQAEFDEWYAETNGTEEGGS